MHILLVNDDGIHAPGIRALAEALVAAGHRVSVCAPDQERSASSHSITLRRSMVAEKTDFPGAEVAYACTGTPADCARLGLYLVEGVDLVISGINNGDNLGGSCVYSGTVGAAMEASMSGTPAMASSLCKYNSDDYSAAAKLTARMAEWVAQRPLARGEIYNLNVPFCAYDEIRGVVPATCAPIYLDSPVYREIQGENGVEYRYTTGENVPIDDPEYDLLKIEEGFATLTKLTWDMRSDAPPPELGDFSMHEKKHYEIERKYLIRMPDAAFLSAQPGCEAWEIEQIYLTAEPGCTRRIRRVIENGEMRWYKTFKRRLSDLSCEEDEGRIDEAEYEVLRREADPALRIIEKTRWRIPFAGQTLEVDRYPFWSDRAILEIELESETQPVQIPDWLDVVREVTDDRRYKNVRLADEIPMDMI